MHVQDTEHHSPSESEEALSRIAGRLLAVMLFGVPLVLVIIKTLFGAWSGSDALIVVAYYAVVVSWWSWYWHRRDTSA